MDDNEPHYNHSGRYNHSNHHAINQLDLIVIIVDDIAGGDLLQVRVKTLVREQEERVTESSTW